MRDLAVIIVIVVLCAGLGLAGGFGRSHVMGTATVHQVEDSGLIAHFRVGIVTDLPGEGSPGYVSIQTVQGVAETWRSIEINCVAVKGKRAYLAGELENTAGYYVMVAIDDGREDILVNPPPGVDKVWTKLTEDRGELERFCQSPPDLESFTEWTVAAGSLTVVEDIGEARKRASR